MEMSQHQNILLLILIITSYMATLCQARNIIVIGAGISGVAAARKLADEGHSVNILEAGNRIGGRIWTRRDGLSNGRGAEVEMGAGWIHGSSEMHPITSLAMEGNRQRYETDWEQIEVAREDGRRVGDRELFEAYGKVEDLLELVGNNRRRFDVNATLKDAITELGYAEYIKGALPKLYLSNMVDFALGASMDKISARLFYTDDEYEGVEEVLVDGYDSIINRLISGNGINQTVLNYFLSSPVTHVVRNGSSLLVLTDGGGRWRADDVIITVPLGVLKAGGVVFIPPLPEGKVEAIRRAGFGLVNKVAVQFSEAFWEREHAGTFAFSLLSGNSSEGDKLLRLYLNMQPATQRPVLMSVALGEDAARLQFMTDTQVEDIVRNRLGVIFGMRDADVPLVRLTRSSWGSDPLFRGSYTYYSAGSRRCDYAWLSVPVCPGLYFAGEHTSALYPGTVHGAYLSGLAAAHTILHHSCQERSHPPDCSEQWLTGRATHGQPPPAALALTLTIILLSLSCLI